MKREKTMTEDEHQHANRLIHETTRTFFSMPIIRGLVLLGEEALSRAKEEDKPILLSIGYSSCTVPCHGKGIV